MIFLLDDLCLSFMLRILRLLGYATVAAALWLGLLQLNLTYTTRLVILTVG